MLKTRNAGKSWYAASLGLSATLIPTTQYGPDPLDVYDRGGEGDIPQLLSADQKSGKVFVGTSNAYWVSDDGGVSWASNQSPRFESRDANNVRTLVSVPDLNGSVYVGVIDRLDRGAVRWSHIFKVSPDGKSIPVKTGKMPKLLGLDPSDPNRMFLTANEPVPLAGGDMLLQGRILLFSDDAGFSWRALNLKTGIRQTVSSHEIAAIRSLSVGPKAAVSVIVDTYVPNTFGQNSQAALSSVDGGTTWRDITPAQPQNTPAPEPLLAITIDPTDANVIYTTKQTSLLRSSDGGRSWVTLFTERGNGRLTSVTVSPADRQILLLSGTGGVRLSNDAGKTWSLSKSGMLGRDIGDNVLRVIATPTGVYAQGRMGIYRLSDPQLTWAKARWDEIDRPPR